MNYKLGVRESSAALVFMCLPQLLLYYINGGISRSNSGFIINFLICSAIAGIFVVLSKKYFSLSDNKYERILNFIFLMYIIPVSLYNLYLCTNALMSVCGDKITPDVLVLIVLLSSGAAAYLGNEAVSRCALISFFICIVILGFISFISYDGWDINNLYPVFGNSYETTFFSFNSIGIYSGLVSVFAIKNNVSDGAYKALKRSCWIVFLLGIALVFLCITTTPYPLGSLYDFSLAGIFSIARSGSFFHRFEIILVFMLVLISFNTLSFSLYLSSEALAKFGGTRDVRPYILLLGALFFYAFFKKSLLNLSFVISNIFAVLLVLIFIVMSIKNKKTGGSL